MKNNKYLSICLCLLAALFLSCSSATKETRPKSKNNNKAEVLGSFSADSAYRYISEQVALGPRVPGTQGHKACKDYIIDKLKSFGVDTLITQDAVIEAFNGDKLPITNIFAGFNTNEKHRVLLVAHWDTRPWADNENSAQRRTQAIPGANDGGSGVGVLLEIARNLSLKRPEAGIDFLFIDAEDYGSSDGFAGNANTWCLGTQYWIDNMTPYTLDSLPTYAILLDMVGGMNARFHYEIFSYQYVPNVCNKIWSEAKRLGYEDIFISSMGGAITDDHIFLTNAGIPTVDIIETLNEVTESFPPTWHTHNDNMENIDKKSLAAVGTTVLNLLYKEPKR